MKTLTYSNEVGIQMIHRCIVKDTFLPRVSEVALTVLLSLHSALGEL